MTTTLLRNLCKTCNYYNTRTVNFRQPYAKIIYSKKYIHTSQQLLRKSIYENEDVKKIQSYVLLRYMDYVKKLMQKQFPAAFRMYQVFTIGIKEFFSDLKSFLRVIRLVASKPKDKGLEILTRKELELYHQMPKDMVKVAPVLILSAVPFSNYVVFPLIYYFPRQLLSSHFWSIQQKSEFRTIYLTKRLRNYRPLFRCMQERLPDLEGNPLYDKWAQVLGVIGSGAQPSTEQILECSSLFVEEPYGIKYMYGNHAKSLARVHSIRGWFRRFRLYDRALAIIEIDRAIMREGGVHNMPSEALREACFMRGLNPTNMSSDEIILWLNQWIAISKTITKENVSLLLHCPILLGYNEPSNWMLLH